MNSSSPLLSDLTGNNNIKLTIFWTVGPGLHAQDVIDDQVSALRESKLLDHVSKIYVSGRDYERINHAPSYAELFAKHADVWKKIQDVILLPDAEEFYKNNTITYEFPSLEGLWDLCRFGADAPSNLVLYMHSKGSTKADSEWTTVSKWRSTLQHFVLHRYTDCVGHLKKGFATCGALMEKRSTGATWPHYRGTFWWARCDYIKELENPRPEAFHLHMAGQPMLPKPLGRFLAEWWLLGSNHQIDASHKNCWGRPAEFTESGLAVDPAAPEACEVVTPTMERSSHGPLEGGKASGSAPQTQSNHEMEKEDKKLSEDEEEEIGREYEEEYEAM
jgi:hypothetical protein